MLTANLYELGTLLLLALSSLALGATLNRSTLAKSVRGQSAPALSKKPATLLAIGFIATAALLVLTFLTLTLIGLQQLYYPASFIVVLVAIGSTAKVWLEQLRQLATAAVLGGVAVAGSFIAVGVIHLRGAPSYDSTFVLSLSHVIQAGEPFSVARDYFKRGLAYPLLHAFSQPGHFAPMVTVFIAALVLFLLVEVITQRTAGLSRRTVQLSYALASALTLTAPMVWNAALYIREHTLMALAIGLLFAMLLTILQTQAPLSREQLIAWMAANVVVVSTRPEGIAIAVIFTLAIYARLNLRQRVAVVLAAVVPVSAWIVTLNYSAVPKLLINQPWLLLLLWAAVAGVAAIKFSAALLRALNWVLPTLLALVLVGEFALFSESLATGLYAQFVNIVLQKGGYSFLMLAAALALIASFFIKNFAIERQVLFVVLSVVLLFLVAKTLDLGILKGEPDLGRIGIGDSLNRMWLHLLLPLVVILYFAVARAIEPLVLKLTRGQKA